MHKRSSFAVIAGAIAVAVAFTSFAVASTGHSIKAKPPAKPALADQLKAKEAPYLQKLIAAAKNEGQLTVYTADSPPEMNQSVADAFKAKYGIQVNILALTETQLQQRLGGEWTAGVQNADVLTAAATQFITDNASHFVAMDDKNVPGLLLTPKQSRPSNLYAFFHVNPTVIQYNTNRVPADKVPKKWTDMLDPFWKNQIDLTDVRSSGSYMAWGLYMLRLYGASYLSGIAAQNPKLVQSGTVGAQDVAAGAVMASFPARTVHSAPLRTQNAPIAFTVLPGSASSTYTSVLSAAPHPNAARLYALFQLGIPTAKILCNLNQGALGTFYSAKNVPECKYHEGPKWKPLDTNVPSDAVSTITNLLLK